MAKELDSELPRIDPAILVFLLYVVILQELVSGWMEYKRQASKPKKQAGPVWSSRCSWSPRASFTRSPMQPVRRERYRDWRKPGRIVRKA
ncbi:hypothetical protein NDU88_012016 [Pleurodeles waltl]|uniref:Uncharacterized protein n=1 Tax=Pleurodeles waltl TaxID=8319 RepID=A0AAV7R1Q3_PLEWA|nr:hypothetical protein NDU88_012016 [Pleurodeles waltl]